MEKNNVAQLVTPEVGAAFAKGLSARTGGQVLVNALLLQGVERVFCVPGESYLDVLDALYDRNEIQVVVAKHEGAAANMAEADGKLTGRPGICMVTRGPGATHASVGVHIAFQDSTPMILFVGQVARGVRGREAFQEVDFASMFTPLAKWATEISDPSRIPEVVARAFQCATSGRPGPVVISLPEDMLEQVCMVSDSAPYMSVKPAPSPGDAAAIRKALASACRPMLIVGGSNWSAQACADLATFVRDWNLPVACSFRRQDLFDNRDPRYAGHLSLGVNTKLAQRIAQADLIFAIGTRLGDITTNGYTTLVPPRIPQRLIHLHTDSTELGRVFQPDIAVQCTPATAAQTLRSLEPPISLTWGRWTEDAGRDLAEFSATPRQDPLHTGVFMPQVMAHLNSVLPDDAVITNGAGNYAVWVHRFYKYRQPRTELAPICGAMGYGLPAAIAAKLRYPSRSVVCFAGDGCFLMYPQELATAMQFNAHVIVIVVNNGMYGTIRMHQEKRFPGRVVGTQIQIHDFVMLAQSFGAHGELVETADAFPAAFERASKCGRPALIELRTDPRQITPQLRLESM